MKKIIGATFFLLVVGGLSAFGIYARLPDWETRAQFGDMFGAINALFSTLALVGVVVAVLIQKQELELQRKELEMTRGELERSAQAHESASSSLREQLDLQVTASRLNGLSAMLASIDAEIARHPSEGGRPPIHNSLVVREAGFVRISCQRLCQRWPVLWARARSLKICPAIVNPHDIPGPQSRFLTSSLHPASVTPLPSGNPAAAYPA